MASIATVLCIQKPEVGTRSVLVITRGWHHKFFLCPLIANPLTCLVSSTTFNTPICSCAGSCEPGSRWCPNERIFGSGRPRGSGFWNEGYMGKGREMGRSVYEQPGNEVDGILSQQGGFQVSKGRRKGSKREWEKGKQTARGLLYNTL